MNHHSETPEIEPRSCTNRLLLALGAETRNEIIAAAERRRLDEGRVLYRPGDLFTHVVFVESGVVSEVTVLEDGLSSESSTIGNESMVGSPSLLMQRRAGRSYIVRVPGGALFVPVERVDDIVKINIAARNIFMRHREAMLNASLQLTACGNTHSIAQRTARWLLKAHDRVHGDRFALRQATLAEAMGVRRASISVVCSALAEKGAIAYVRGLVSIEDRGLLEASACGCYRVIRRGFDDALGPPRTAKDRSP